MSAMAAAYSTESSSKPSFLPGVRVSLDDVAGIARRRASKLNTPLPTEFLVRRTMERFDATFGRTLCPVDLDGWIRRAMREVVATERSTRPAAYLDDHLTLTRLLEGLVAPVRSPALAKQRKLLLRRVSQLIVGPERRVVFAMINQPSPYTVADQLGISPIEVARLHNLGLLQLKVCLDRDPELERQLKNASRQPRRARTSR